jgi:hypothetical protein
MNIFEILLFIRGAEKSLELAAKRLEMNDPVGVQKELFNAQSELAYLRESLEGPTETKEPSPGRPGVANEALYDILVDIGKWLKEKRKARAVKYFRKPKAGPSTKPKKRTKRTG